MNTNIPIRKFHRMQEAKPKRTRKAHMRIRIGFLALLIIGIIYTGVQVVIFTGKFFDNHKIVTHQVLKVEINPPFTIESRKEKPRPEAQKKKEYVSPLPEGIEPLESYVPKAKAQIPIVAKLSSPVENWRPLVAKYFPPAEVDNALKVLNCESRGDPNAKSGTDDHGLFQIHAGLATYGQKIYDPEFNVKLAYNHYFKNRFWQPWVCARKLGII